MDSDQKRRAELGETAVRRRYETYPTAMTAHTVVSAHSTLSFPIAIGLRAVQSGPKWTAVGRQREGSAGRLEEAGRGDPSRVHTIQKSEC